MFSRQEKKNFNFVWGQMIARLSMMIILQCIQMSNHYVAHVKLI